MKLPTNQKDNSINVKKKKSLQTARKLWLSLGWVGIHRLYAGRYDSGLTMFGIVFLSLALSVYLYIINLGQNLDGFNPAPFLISLYISFMMVVIVPWWITDRSLIGDMVDEHNNIRPQNRDQHLQNDDIS